ncbi:hypothetical protein GCM10010528_04440 [Gordonia defluvii]|jgi:hypothetical protein|uniref:Uncharacterized protein n=1 Tax=Gordonia defluvii TaxID=283718 RepID=A0ABN3YFH3_9ACTN
MDDWPPTADDVLDSFAAGLSNALRGGEDGIVGCSKSWDNELWELARYIVIEGDNASPQRIEELIQQAKDVRDAELRYWLAQG